MDLISKRFTRLMCWKGPGGSAVKEDQDSAGTRGERLRLRLQKKLFLTLSTSKCLP